MLLVLWLTLELPNAEGPKYTLETKKKSAYSCWVGSVAPMKVIKLPWLQCLHLRVTLKSVSTQR